jgi:hypothetical protein
MILRRSLLAAVALFCVALAYFVYSEPHVRAYLCPACSGFHEVAPRIYADNQASDAQVDAALQSFGAAQDMLQKVYPDRAADPVWLLCLSGDCGVTTGPTPQAMAYANSFVFVYPEGANPTILAHELAHTELHARLGSLRRLVSQPVPTWFDEGLAVLVSHDPRFLEVDQGVVTGCKAGDWPVPPADQRSFRKRAASETQALYTASACMTIDWLDDHGGVSAMPVLLDQIRSGDLAVQ